MKVVAFKRETQGTGASRRLRIAGKTPGIIYGGTEAPVAIELDHNALYHALKKETFHSSILDLEIEGTAQKVLLRDFQMHAYKQLVLHVDFQRVNDKDKIHIRVPLHFLNQEECPAVKLSAGVINHVMNDLEVSCAASKLPEFIEVDLAQLEIGQSLHLFDLKLPEGVSLVSQENLTVVTAAAPTDIPVDDADDAAASEAASKE